VAGAKKDGKKIFVYAKWRYSALCALYQGLKRPASGHETDKKAWIDLRADFNTCYSLFLDANNATRTAQREVRRVRKAVLAAVTR